MKALENLDSPRQRVLTAAVLSGARSFTGPPVVFAWRDYWVVISAGGKPMAGHSFSRAPDLCTSVDTGLPSPYPHVPGNLWALMFAWHEDAGGPALAGEPASGREFRLQLQQSADGKPPTAMTMNREAIDGDAYRQLRHVKAVASKIKASWPGASLRESAGKPRQPSPGSTNRRGLVGGRGANPWRRGRPPRRGHARFVGPSRRRRRGSNTSTLG